MLYNKSNRTMNRETRRANKVQIVNGEVVVKETKRDKAVKREETNVALIVNQLRNRKKVSKTKALKLAKINVAELLGKGKDKTSFMSMAYSEQESQVGKVTNNMATICSLTKRAWTLEDGSIDVELFYRAFVCCDKENAGDKEHWDSVFTGLALTKEVALYNCANMKYDVYYISNVQIEAFRNQLMELNPSKLTYEDIVAIQADLYHLFRAYQESSIDVTKDKTKDYKIKWDEIIGYVPRLYSSKSKDYEDNLVEVMKDRTIKYELRVYSNDEAKETRNDILCASLEKVHVDFINEEVLKTAEDSITDLLKDVVGTSDALSTEAKLHAESIISIVSSSFKSLDSLTTEECKAIRNALYTIVAEEAETVEEATAMVIDLICAKYRVNHKGEVIREDDISKLRQGCTKVILGGILPLYLNGQNTYTRVFDNKGFTLFQELEDAQKFEVYDGDIIADGVLVGCLNFNNDNEDEICAITTDAAYVIDGQLYIEQDIYEDIDCEVNTMVIENLYVAGTVSAADVKDGEHNDNYGRDTYNDLVSNTVAVKGKNHNIAAIEDINGRMEIRGKLNAYSANRVVEEGIEVLDITTDNSIAFHIPYNKETDTYEYCCEVLVFC